MKAEAKTKRHSSPSPKLLREDEFSWPEEVAAETPEVATAQPEQPADEISAPTEAARAELAKEEPIAVEPVAATPPQAPVRQPEAIASEPEPLTFAAAAEPVEPEVRPRPN